MRPISLTCQLAKVLEGLTLARVYPSIVGNLDRNQLAVARKSIEQAVVYLLHLALEALDSGGCYVRLFFADFKKGFDVIDHLILMEKLGSHAFWKGGGGGSGHTRWHLDFSSFISKWRHSSGHKIGSCVVCCYGQ